VPNPQVALATLDGATNVVPAFITPDGPVREARFRGHVESSRCAARYPHLRIGGHEVVGRFNRPRQAQQQDLLNFLRAL
jgi:hypothetical protein